MPRDDPNHGGLHERDAAGGDDRPQPATRGRAATQQSAAPDVVRSPSGLTLYVFGTDDLDAILDKAPALFRTTTAQQSREARQRGVRDDLEVTAGEDGGGYDAIAPNGNCASCPTNVIC
jgi:hypothetical protein